MAEREPVAYLAEVLEHVEGGERWEFSHGRKTEEKKMRFMRGTPSWQIRAPCWFAALALCFLFYLLSPGAVTGVPVGRRAEIGMIASRWIPCISSSIGSVKRTS